MKRISSIVMIVMLGGTLLFGGCAEKGQEKTAGEQEITVAVNSETGGLDPADDCAYLSFLFGGAGRACGL